MTLKYEVMMLKIQHCFTGINYILKCIQIENHFFCIFDQIDTAFSIRNNITNLTDSKLYTHTHARTKYLNILIHHGAFLFSSLIKM